MDQIKIAHCDQGLLFREGLSLMFNSQENMEVVISVENGEQLIKQLKECTSWPDILFVDVKLGDMTGPHCLKKIGEEFPGHQLKIIVLSEQYSPSFIMHMLEKGVNSYIHKNTSPQDLFHITQKVHQQGSFYTPELIRIIQDSISKPLAVPNFFNRERITRREKEILELICQEYSSQEIAEKLYISPRTVEGHRNKLMEKTNSKNTVGLVMYAIVNQLIKPEKKMIQAMAS